MGIIWKFGIHLCHLFFLWLFVCTVSQAKESETCVSLQWKPNSEQSLHPQFSRWKNIFLPTKYFGSFRENRAPVAGGWDAGLVLVPTKTFDDPPWFNLRGRYADQTPTMRQCWGREKDWAFPMFKSTFHCVAFHCFQCAINLESCNLISSSISVKFSPLLPKRIPIGQKCSGL